MSRSCSFGVGPSRVIPAFARYAREAYKEGLLSVNHRSTTFAQLIRRTRELLTQKLDIPTDYGLIFCSSATECWEIIAQSLTLKGSYHLSNGSFGEKWEATAAALHKSRGRYDFPLQTTAPLPEFPLPKGIDLLACTQNETSNGTHLPASILRILSNRCHSEGLLLATDLTSSLGAVEVPWDVIDIGFASVQKGLGLPAGMALLLSSPAAHQRAEAIGETSHYNSYLRSAREFNKEEAPYTPNVLNIYLLMRSLEERPSIVQIATRTSQRAKKWYSFLEQASYDLLIDKASALRSETVIALRGKPTQMSKLFESLQEAQMPVSRGHGKWKENTLRIANFPAIRQREINALRHFLSSQKTPHPTSDRSLSVTT